MSEVSEVSEADWAVWRDFHLMRRQLDRALEQRLQSDAGISVAEYEILIVLFKAPGKRLRAREISDITGWEKSRVSHQVTRMQARGLVERTECDEDLRGTWISLTPDGRRKVLRAMRDHSAAIREYFVDPLDDHHKAVLLEASGRVLDAIDPPICDVLKPAATAS